MSAAAKPLQGEQLSQSLSLPWTMGSTWSEKQLLVSFMSCRDKSCDNIRLCHRHHAVCSLSSDIGSFLQ